MDGTATVDVMLAAARLPERQREALELREVRGLSYDGIAARLGASRDAIPLLVAHARINLYDELYGTILASVAPSPDCERVLGLIAACEDDQLGDPSEASWLEAHLESCDRCRRGVEEMREASLAYRASAPGVVAKGARDEPRSRRRAVIAITAAGLLLLVGAAAAFVGGDSPSAPLEPALSTARGAESPSRASASKKGGSGEAGRPGAKNAGTKGGAAEASQPDADASGGEPALTAPVSSEVPAAAPGTSPSAGGRAGSGGRPSSNAAVGSPQQTVTPKPSPKPPPAPTSSPTPAPASGPVTAEAPAASEVPPSEESVEEPSRRREPPGKPAHVPNK